MYVRERGREKASACENDAEVILGLLDASKLSFFFSNVLNKTTALFIIFINTDSPFVANF